jgi:hypothetical protein
VEVLVEDQIGTVLPEEKAVIDGQQSCRPRAEALVEISIEVVAVHNDPLRRQVLGEGSGGISITAAAGGFVMDQYLDAFGTEAFQKDAGTLSEEEEDPSTGILPRLRQRQAAHDMAGAHALPCIDAKEQGSRRVVAHSILPVSGLTIPSST